MSQKQKILWFGDLVNPSGFGRIGNEVTTRLVQRGWPVVGASIPWTGYPWNPLPYPVWGFGGVDIWNRVGSLAQAEQPDVIVCCQDMPYAQTLFFQCRIDWSKTKLIIVTPIDGTPVHPEWLRMVDLTDATMVISKFGVEGMRSHGKQVGLLHPGVDTGEFYPAADGEVKKIREKMGIDPDAFVVGMFAMNQGRKAISATLDVFTEFARDKPEAILYLDMDKISPAGWDIPSLIQQIGLPPERVKFREDAFNAGMENIRERVLLMDVHSVVSHREGFGLPLVESMACKIPTMALDWCSGSEIVGGGKGMLIRRLPYMERGSWGGARDAFPDMKDWLKKLNLLYRDPDERIAIGAKGYQWAVKQSWDVAANQFENKLLEVISTQAKERANEPAEFTIPAPTLADHGRISNRHLTLRPDGIHHSADLQQPAVSDSMHEIAGGNGGPQPDGDTGPG